MACRLTVLTVLFQTQIQMHVNLHYCTDKEPLVYEYGKRGSKGMSLEEVITLCQIRPTHTLDKSGPRPPPNCHVPSCNYDYK
jgi:hypothetical protein